MTGRGCASSIPPASTRACRTLRGGRRTPRTAVHGRRVPLDDEGQTVAPGNVSARPPKRSPTCSPPWRRLGHRPPSCCTPRCTSRPHAGATSSAHGTCSTTASGRRHRRAPSSAWRASATRATRRDPGCRPHCPAGLKYQASGHEQRRGGRSSVSGHERRRRDPGWFGVRCVFRTSDRRPTRSASPCGRRAPRPRHRAGRGRGPRYSGLVASEYLRIAQAYWIGTEQPSRGSEVFSLLRESDLDATTTSTASSTRPRAPADVE